MNADEITGEKVHILLRRRGIQQQELADVLGTTQTSVSRKILGKRSWSLDEILATAKFLDLPVTELLPGNDYAPVPAGRGRSADLVRLEGLEPPTFWLVGIGNTKVSHFPHNSAALQWSEADDLAYLAECVVRSL